MYADMNQMPQSNPNRVGKKNQKFSSDVQINSNAQRQYAHNTAYHTVVLP